MPIDWRILGGGLAFGAVVAALALGGVPFAQEIIFVVSMAVICTMLVLVTRELAPETRRAILYTTIIIFAFRATPSVGDGYFWWTLDVLKFDADFYGTLRQTGALLALVGHVAVREAARPNIPRRRRCSGSRSREHCSRCRASGFITACMNGPNACSDSARARSRLIDTATASPFAQLSMIPLLTLIAFYAPAGHRATWFALMASLMNMALVAGQLQTKYLNHLFVVERGQYGELGLLLVSATVLAFVIPICAILAFGRRI